MPTIKYSNKGKIHFEEVRYIIQNVIKIFIVCFIVCFIGIITNIKNKNIEFLKEEVLSLLKSKLKHIEYYLIGEEKHEDGGIHIHCFFELKTSFDTMNVKYLDLELENQIYHGNYQIGKKKIY